MKIESEITKSGTKEFEETSWKVANNKKLVDSLIGRVEKAKEDAKMWEHRYRVCGKDLSHVQSIMMRMTESATETQAVLYRDRALHYLKSVGAGGGIKESKVAVGVAETGDSLLADALKVSRR